MNEIKHIQKILTPIILEKGMPGYDLVQDIEEKLNDPEVFNIAITGPYGSGKSTVLKSLKTIYPNNHTYLTISLASLTGERENGNELKGEEQQKVEYSILQQLIYKEKPETLPNSRFRRIEQRTKKKAIGYGIATLAFIIAFLIVFEPQWARVDTFYDIFNFGYGWNLTFDICFSLYMLFFVFKVASYLYMHPSVWRVKALNMKDFSIEIGQDSSVFNKHLEEIVYYFESTEYDVVIIEDLDRFRCPEIFQKLREINFLLQQSEVLKEQRRHIKFIYAVKDDLFKDAERTKFFDYIATVTPVVNPKNSCEKLTQELAERGYTLNKDTLQDLSEFVDDMRMLKNVANEFQQYMERLSKSSSPNKEKLLAMIIYKNHHPDDFGKLHYKDGKVYEFIKKKSDWTKVAIEKVITPRLDIWQKKREDVLNSQKLTLKQWRIIYMEKYRQHLTSTLVSLSAKGAYHFVSEFVESPELFEELIRQRRVSYRYTQYQSNQNANADINFSDLEKEVDDKVGYMKRKELAVTSTSDIDNEIRLAREEANRLKNFKLAKLLIQFPEIKKSKEFTDLGLSELMVHFLQRGYIDETYYDYLTLYDGTTMSLNDRDLLSRIRQNDTNVTYEEEIDDIEAFVNELPLFVYEYKSVLNYQIADHLENHPVKYNLALQSFEQHFLNSSVPPLDFMADYYKRIGCGKEKLWKRFIKIQSSWQKIQAYEKQEYWDTLVEAWLQYCEPVDITDSIRKWLNSNLGFCVERLGEIGLEHLKEIIDGCLFENISALGPIGGQNQGEDVIDVANFILENKLFELTDNNIFVACEITSSPFSERSGVEYLTISDIISSGNNGFKEYVFENIKEVFADIINKSRGQEDEAGLVFILNLEELEENQKISYLKRQTKDKVFDIMDIKDPYKPFAIRGSVLEPSWVNMQKYFAYDQEMISEDMENYINNNVESLLKNEYPNDVESSLAGEIVYGPYLNISAYEKLLPVLIHNVNEDDEIKISKDTGIEKIKLLVKNNYLSDNVETAKVVAFYGVSLYAKYLSHHINSFISNYEDYDTNTKTLTVLLDKESSLTNGQRWNLAKKVSADLISQDSELANVILALMLKKKEELTWPVVEATIKKAYIMPQKQQYQEWLIKRYKGSIEKVIAIIKTMVYPYFEIADDSKRPLIPKGFKVYLDILEPLGIFTSFKEEDKGYRVYHSTK
ncbi:MAG: P-loop NTPase fold protein [Prevotella sp.]|nr:P-loop NTPase fold protein [Prevotella sp.]